MPDHIDFHPPDGDDSTGPRNFDKREMLGPLDYFKLFITEAMLQVIIANTNKHGARKHAKQSRNWVDLTMEHMWSFLAMVIYMGFVPLKRLAHYWNQSALYNLPFPREVMSGQMFQRIAFALHISDPDQDVISRNAAIPDKLYKIKPLYTDLVANCRKYFSPGRQIAIDERMVKSKARVSIKQYIKLKPVKWGFKLFVLADSKTGYTWNFSVYCGKESSRSRSKNGLSYDAVWNLLHEDLGTGYELYTDSFYTSQKLFTDLRDKKRINACGTVQVKRKGFPRSLVNGLTSKSERGSIRWIRRQDLLYVWWRDNR